MTHPHVDIAVTGGGVDGLARCENQSPSRAGSFICQFLAASDVMLGVYDMLGGQVGLLVNDTRTPGKR